MSLAERIVKGECCMVDLKRTRSMLRMAHMEIENVRELLTQVEQRIAA